MGPSASIVRPDFASLTEALAARFPVCRSLVGDDFFRTMSHTFIAISPPHSPDLMTCCNDFGDFIDTIPSARSMQYLGDVARLEAAIIRASHAPDANPLSVCELAAFAAHAWERCLAVLHPTIQVVRSRYPIVTIWEAEIAEPNGVAGISTPEDALVARLDLKIEVHRLPPGGAVFVQLLMSRATFREAAEKAALADPGFDLVTSLSALLGRHLIVGLASPS